MSRDLIEKLKNSNIPNSYYALIALAFASIIGVVYLIAIGLNTKEINQDVATNNTPVKSNANNASQIAQNSIWLDMSREDVISALGKADWAAIPGDTGTLSLPDETFGLELRWNNPACRDVVVMFSTPPHRVIGWDDGNKFCSMAKKDDRAEFSCALPDRKELCE
ncbi:MAG: hypothetical protein MK052_12015 [Alphaproteobacteria bacterium]|nr:hypothetical protein [Alphaproteobacteria bacterium]